MQTSVRGGATWRRKQRAHAHRLGFEVEALVVLQHEPVRLPAKAALFAQLANFARVRPPVRVPPSCEDVVRARKSALALDTRGTSNVFSKTRPTPRCATWSAVQWPVCAPCYPRARSPDKLLQRKSDRGDPKRAHCALRSPAHRTKPASMCRSPLCLAGSAGTTSAVAKHTKRAAARKKHTCRAPLDMVAQGTKRPTTKEARAWRPLHARHN